MKSPHRKFPIRNGYSLIATVLILAVAAPAAQPAPQDDGCDAGAETFNFAATWQSLYSTSSSDDNLVSPATLCQLCHIAPNGGDPWNAYGWALRTLADGGLSNSESILAAESLDSDGDPSGSSNLDETAWDTQPGWTAGASNTAYSKNGTTQTGLLPPSGILGNVDPAPWVDLGGGTPGIDGVPVLTGSGPLTAGSTLTLDLQQGPPGALALLWLSTASSPLTALGGTVHAFPYLDQVLLATDGAGAINGGIVFPPGVPSGSTLYFQWLLQDASTLHGITLSNGVRGTTP